MDTPVVPGYVLSHLIDEPTPPWAPAPVGPVRRGVAALRWPAPHGVMTGNEAYLARRDRDGAQVVVKLYARPLRGAREQRRYQEEVSALRALAGQRYVLAPTSAGVADGHAFVVSPYCGAGSLEDHLVTVGRFTPVEVCRIGAKIAAGLALAHALGVVHRRVKPANVLIDADGEPRLADFGLASLTLADGGALAPEGLRPFTVPEAYLPELMSASADVYALGATLYALLAGWSPRTGTPVATMLDPDAVRDLPNVAPRLTRELRRALAIDPRERQPDAAGFGRALAAAG